MGTYSRRSSVARSDAWWFSASTVFVALLSNATTPDYRILVKRDRSKANYAVRERCGAEGIYERS